MVLSAHMSFSQWGRGPKLDGAIKGIWTIDNSLNNIFLWAPHVLQRSCP